MKKPVVSGCGLLLTVVVVGCGGSSDDAIMKEQISLLNQTSAIWEKVTDAKTYEEAKSQSDSLEKANKGMDTRTKDWSEDKKKAMLKKYESELKPAVERALKARMTAEMKAKGLGLDKIPPFLKP